MLKYRERYGYQLKTSIVNLYPPPAFPHKDRIYTDMQHTLTQTHTKKDAEKWGSELLCIIIPNGYNSMHVDFKNYFEK